LTLADKPAVNQALLKSGATIGEMNTVRRHLSALKGGRLATACHPAQVWTLLISGALGDAVVTGPTLTNVNDFRAIVIDLPSTPQAPSEAERQRLAPG
jgi:hydroxypyruvate reductase